MKPISPILAPSFYHGADYRSLIATLVASCAMHVALIVLAVFMVSNSDAYHRSAPSVINVTMVSLPSTAPHRPAPGPPEPSAAQKVETPPKKKPQAPVSVQEKALPQTAKPEAVSIAKKTAVVEPKKSLKKKTFKPDKALASAIKRIEAKAETTRPDPVAQALERLKKDVEKGPPGEAAGSALPGGLVGGSGPSAGGQSGPPMGPLDLYKLEISYRVEKNWAFSEQIAGNIQNAETRLVITIAPSGQIQDIWFEKKSGNAYLDESAFRAVKKANPLPPLPAGFRSSYSVGLIFTPSGLKK